MGPSHIGCINTEREWQSDDRAVDLDETIRHGCAIEGQRNGDSLSLHPSHVEGGIDLDGTTNVCEAACGKVYHAGIGFLKGVAKYERVHR